MYTANKIMSMCNLIESAIEVHNLLKNDVDSRSYSQNIFNREHRSIHLSLGRQTCKTASIGILSSPDDMIIFDNHRIKNSFIRNYPKCESTILSANNFSCHNETIVGRKYDIVWIDEPALHHDLYDYYNIDANLFILLGN